MKKLLRTFVVETLALYLASQIADGMVFTNSYVTLLMTGAALTVATYLVRPTINLLLLPLNMITFGLFKWVSHAIMMYIVTLVVPGFSVVGFSFPGLQTDFLILPPVSLSAGIFAYAFFSFLISIITGIVYWIIK